MQPQNSGPIAPISPNPSYDFIYKDPPKPKRGPFKLPNMPKPMLLLVGGVIVLVLVIIIAVIVGRGSNDSQKYIELMSRSQEIVRVSDIVKPLTKNTDTLSLIATTEAALSSEQSSLSNYLATNGTKVGVKDLTLYLDKTSDDKIQAATQNNNLDSTYAKYLKDQLNSYLSQLQSTHKVAGKNAKVILDNAISSTETILNSPLLSAAQ
ncbi:hypothetical protein COU91_00180 [Candidatus Saccharibacteria bacterium CG10_big_fil_rev_8_21_14_0_10_47_8]|nr:MAG: hypothetical protein COU91_00180 [Candidatus Saccharibacteria bacterium CG10_big_fil_rev_8_21_14_0_10_47_8]